VVGVTKDVWSRLVAAVRGVLDDVLRAGEDGGVEDTEGALDEAVGDVELVGVGGGRVGDPVGVGA
jgi:hypothetical protein